MLTSTRRVLLLLLSFGNAVSSQTYQPITSLNLDAYLGRWYQTYTNLGFILLELGAKCTTADYTKTADGNVALVNQSRPPLIPQIFARTTGFAVQNPSGVQGAFTVAQQYLKEIDEDDVKYEAPGNYWIIGIGPIVNNQYQWAVVSNPGKTLCFVIARDGENFKGTQYEEDALAVLETFGFNTIKNKPLPTSHVGCKGYPDK
jgi:apolipoprotein D and lipocalin family protein